MATHFSRLAMVPHVEVDQLDVELGKGMQVEFEVAGAWQKGVVNEIGARSNVVTVKDDKGRVHQLDLRQRMDRDRLKWVGLHLKRHVPRWEKWVNAFWAQVEAVRQLLLPQEVRVKAGKRAMQVRMDFLDRSRYVERRNFEEYGNAVDMIPPIPSGGWVWRPAKIDMSSISEHGREHFHVLFLDEKQPDQLDIDANDSDQLMAKFQSRSTPGTMQHGFQKERMYPVKWFYVNEQGHLEAVWELSVVKAVTEYFVYVETLENSEIKRHDWIHVLEDADRLE